MTLRVRTRPILVLRGGFMGRKGALFSVIGVLLVPLWYSAQEAATATSPSGPQTSAIMAASLAALNPAGSALPGSVVASGTHTQFLAGSAESSSLQVKILGLDQF